MKQSVFVIFCILLLGLSITSRAEVSSQPLPNFGNLAALLINAGKSKVDEAVYHTNGRISANLPASDSARGRTAGNIAGLLSGGSERLRLKMREDFLRQREVFEKNLTDNNYALHDMGVAYAVAFVMLWELASDRVLPPAASNRAAKYLVYALRNAEEGGYAKTSDDDNSKAYDWLITYPVVYASLVSAFEKGGSLKRGGDVAGDVGVTVSTYF